MDNKNNAASTDYNLDDGQEFFTFKVKGLTYRFRYPTLEEAEKFKDMQDDEEKAKEALFSYITPVASDTPIAETYKKMNIKEAQRFMEMVNKEFNA